MVLAEASDRFEVVGLSAHTQAQALQQQVQALRPQAVAMTAIDAPFPDKPATPGCRWFAGPDALCQMLAHCAPDILVVGISGLAGLSPTLWALSQGLRVLTANKETFVAAGQLIRPYLSQVIPIDSEHSAIHQCLQGVRHLEDVSRLILTSSGGPFRSWTPAQIAQATVEDALEHPNWRMGKKITVDSATMMNKGLEIIEAHWLFGVPLPHIDVVIHPPSWVHSGVMLRDGSLLLQVGPPDMRGPIRYGLGFPGRLPAPEPEFQWSLTQVPALTFEAPDETRFPCLRLAREAAAFGGLAPTVLNAADEVLVAGFLSGEISFSEISQGIETLLTEYQRNSTETQPASSCTPTLEAVYAWDAWARQRAEALIGVVGGGRLPQHV
jgi:1-deoxy-D-xylulose-5-phosphate reductoisomerase